MHTRWRVNALVFLGAPRECGVRKSQSAVVERVVVILYTNPYTIALRLGLSGCILRLLHG